VFLAGRGAVVPLRLQLAFTEGNQFFGGFDRIFLKGTFDPLKGEFARQPRLQGVVIPELVYVASRRPSRPSLLPDPRRIRRAGEVLAVLLFIVLWFTFRTRRSRNGCIWPGPDAFTDQAAADKATALGGMIWQWGALDYAGGTVVHINSGIAGLVGAYVIGKRIGWGKESMTPHNLR